MDPDNLPKATPNAMNFGGDLGVGSSGTTVKAWKDIWGAGQGIGAVSAVLSCAQLVENIKAQYRAAHTRLESQAKLFL